MRMRGGHHLRGHIEIGGSKNAIFPLVAASLLIKGAVTLTHVPRISDNERLLEILIGMGARVNWLDAHTLSIDTAHIDPTQLDIKAMRRMRASILLLGPMLARFKKTVVPEPGGCIIGNRPIDEHLRSLTALGAQVETDSDGNVEMHAKELVGGYVIMRFSVTATENVIMAAVTAKGKTSIRLAAAEPHVQDLCNFLNVCGAKIQGIGTHDLEITGVKQLHAPKEPWTVIPDTNEIGAFAVAAALTRGELEMSPIVPAHLDALRSTLTQIGVRQELNVRRGTYTVQGGGRMEAFKLQTMIYPGFPTDVQAPFGLLATQCQGTSLIHEPLFESRLGYINELIKMGANAVIADPHRVVISGPTPLRGTEIRSLDLRAGATMVLVSSGFIKIDIFLKV